MQYTVKALTEYGSCRYENEKVYFKADQCYAEGGWRIEFCFSDCADAFVKLFDRYGTFGQFVHQETGEMLVGLSCAGASAIGGLVRAYEYFKEEKYLRTGKHQRLGNARLRWGRVQRQLLVRNVRCFKFCRVDAFTRNAIVNQKR